MRVHECMQLQVCPHTAEMPQAVMWFVHDMHLMLFHWQQTMVTSQLLIMLKSKAASSL